MSKKDLRGNVIRALIYKSELSCSEIATIVRASRVSVSNVLHELCSAKVIESTATKARSKRYAIKDDLCFVMLKLYSDTSQIVTYSRKDGVHRENLEPLYSLSPSDNITFFAQRIADVCEALIQDKKRAIATVIYDKKKLDVPLPKLFLCKENRAVLITSALTHSSYDGSVLYLNTDHPFSLLYHSGSSLGGGNLPNESLTSILSKALVLFHPDLIALDSKPDTQIELLCQANQIDLAVLPSSNALALDEREMICLALLNTL